MPPHAHASHAAVEATPGQHLFPGLQWPTDKPLDGQIPSHQSHQHQHQQDTQRPRSSTASSQTCCSADDSLEPRQNVLVPSVVVDSIKTSFSSASSVSPNPAARRRKAASSQHSPSPPADSPSLSAAPSSSADSPSSSADHTPRRPEALPPSPHIPRQSSFASAAQRFPRISRPVELLRPSYDCVVIGSGYGGAVAASRLARAGQSVCLLELGSERWPGEYPETAGDAFSELHCTGQVTPEWAQHGVDVNTGKKTGMYHLIFGKGQNAFVCNGLGGTSLVNANIFLRADNATLSSGAWPSELRKEGALDEYYAKVEAVLEPEAYPQDWPALPKLDLLKKQAEDLNLGHKFYRPPQTTRFRNGPNACGVEMQPSTLSGQDATGINDGSKTTTLVTYLADAWNWGAELFCECEVRHIEKAKDGYRVYFAWHGRGRPRFGNEHENLMWVHAKDAVFLGAGAFGTTEILLRSKQSGLSLSSCVGQNMSGNGDILAFGYNTQHQTNAVGNPHPSPYHPIGPTITGIIDNRSGHANPQDGFVIEEGVIPQALAGFLQTMLELIPGSASGSGSCASSPPDGIVQKSKAALSSMGSHLLGPYFRQGSVEKTQVYLVMSHDSSQAVLSLHDDKPVLEFLGVARSGHAQHIQALLAKATEAVGGTFISNPFLALMEEQVTVHPIGGAAMARDNTGKTGASDHAGRLFTGNGSDVYPGLVVMDASAIPTSLGVNPLATIAALAERSVDTYIQSRGLVARTDSNGILDLFGTPAHPLVETCETDRDASESISRTSHLITRAAHQKSAGFGFTEVMSGFLHYEDDVDGTAYAALQRDDSHARAAFEQAHRRAKGLSESARFFLSAQAFDTSDLVNDPGHHGLLTGTFVCPTLPGSPFMVQRGAFGLFVMDHQAPGTRNMTYDFDMRGTDGQVLHFHGLKVVDSSVALAPLQLWKATTTLYVSITSGHKHSSAKRLVAKGIMQIGAGDFVSQIMTMAPSGSSLLKKAVSAASFMTYFARRSLGLFLAPLAPLQYPAPSCTGYINDTKPTKVWTDVRARDGIYSRLHMWEPEPQYVVQRDGRHGHADADIPSILFVPGASVDHQIFALPTIPFNAVNYFTRAGYRVFVSVHRIGQVMACENNWTTFDARLDLRAALERIRALYGGGNGPAAPGTPPKKIYTVAHCMGSVALSTGLLDGTIPADWVLGLSCSQVFMNPIWNTANMAKATAGIGPVTADRVYRWLCGSWMSCSTSPDDTLLQRALNQALRLRPDARHELCSSAACHRTSLVFGRCWNHANLNEATHRQIDRFFGGVNMTLLRLLMLQGSQGHAMANAPLFEVLVTPANVQRLRGLPVFQFVGADNAVLSTRSTEKTYEILCDTFGGPLAAPTADHPHGVQYRRRVIPGYGHLDCWMGRNAWRDVYPVLRAEIDRVVRGEDYTFAEPEASVCRFTRMMEAGEI